MKFTVLGASGYIGRSLCKFLMMQGHEVFAPYRDDPKIFTDDLGYVVYAIGLTADFRSKSFETVQAHVGVLQQVLQYSRFSSLLYLSSTRLYSGAESTQEEADLMVRSQNPSDLYNLSKLLGESLCLNSGRSNVRIVRLSNVIGGENEGSDLFFFSLLRDARAGSIKLQSHPDSEKDYVLIEDAIELIYRITVQGNFNVYNVASGCNLSHRQLIAIMSKAFGCNVEFADGAKVISFPVIDINRIVEEYSFTPSNVSLFIGNQWEK
ncbi:NAD-dependent epimerase/dehydratase family protein [Deefgea tanakiae]|uniref:NAD-dependent epimerase/dehydratase family protein n=1 Tax=Deefgea tanakiae TaxID=2865840 RepID=A0ABX8ZDK0_9NEIS|nr:NAD-dependent epimerase/dehydratase family protein [Deefgea tanakiae]QZA79208.1 NAD-dependent epimerase/dehydratase family protein [Deefgea tanakiae]